MKTFATLEEAACGDIPPEYVQIVHIDVRGDQATVWTLMNEAPDFEPYEVCCFRESDGRWSIGAGENDGLSWPRCDGLIWPHLSD